MRLCALIFSCVNTADGFQEVVIDVAPKKANWDLKRDIAKKMQKLERRTQVALLEIMKEMEREQFEKEGGVADAEGSEVNVQ